VFETFVTLDDIVHSNECTNVSHTHTHTPHLYTPARLNVVYTAILLITPHCIK